MRKPGWLPGEGRPLTRGPRGRCGDCGPVGSDPAPPLSTILGWIPAARADLRSREAGVQAWLSGPRRWSPRRPSAKSAPRLVLVRVRDTAGCQRRRDPCDSLQVGDAKALAQGSGRCLGGGGVAASWVPAWAGPPGDPPPAPAPQPGDPEPRFPFVAAPALCF